MKKHEVFSHASRHNLDFVSKLKIIFIMSRRNLFDTIGKTCLRSMRSDSIRTTRITNSARFSCSSLVLSDKDNSRTPKISKFDVRKALASEKKLQESVVVKSEQAESRASVESSNEKQENDTKAIPNDKAFLDEMNFKRTRRVEYVAPRSGDESQRREPSPQMAPEDAIPSTLIDESKQMLDRNKQLDRPYSVVTGRSVRVLARWFDTFFASTSTFFCF
jgi:hypothetical protein